LPNYIPSITEDQAFDALATFLGPLCDNAEILKSQSNRTATPVNAYVELTPLIRKRLRWSDSALNTAGDTRNIGTAIQLNVQIDLYSPDAGDWVAALETVWTTGYPSSVLNPLGVAPLTLSDGIQSALANGEEQYQDRWTLTLALQYNPIVSVPVQSANKLAMHQVEEV